MTPLNSYPRLRQLNLRAELRMDFLASTRGGYRVASAGQLVGAHQVQACTLCATGHGPFYECVVAPGGLWGGACCACRFYDKHKECSLYSM